MIVVALMGVAATLLAALVHEAGHVLACRWLNVSVREISFGIGPVVFSRGTKTKLTLRLIPIAAFVDMEKPKDLRGALIALGGPIAGLVVGVPLLLAMPYQAQPASFTAVFPSGDLAHAGVLPGDTIVRVGESAIHSDIDLYAATIEYRHTSMPLMVERDGERIPLVAELVHPPHTRPFLGVSHERLSTPRRQRRNLASPRFVSLMAEPSRDGFGETLACLQRPGHSIVVDETHWSAAGVLPAGTAIHCVNGTHVATPPGFRRTLHHERHRYSQRVYLGIPATRSATPVVVELPLRSAERLRTVLSSETLASSRSAAEASVQLAPSLALAALSNVVGAHTARLPQPGQFSELGRHLRSELVSISSLLANPFYQLLWWTGVISIFLSLANLLPIPPLDGYRVVSSLTSRRTRRLLNLSGPALAMIAVLWFLFR